MSSLQIYVDAVVNTGPREDSTRIGSQGTVRRQAVDVSPLRRVNQAIALLTIGVSQIDGQLFFFTDCSAQTRESAFRNVKSISECLADELINAAKGSSNSYAIKASDCFALACPTTYPTLDDRKRTSWSVWPSPTVDPFSSRLYVLLSSILACIISGTRNLDRLSYSIF